MNKIFISIFTLIFSIQIINVNIARMSNLEKNLHDLKQLNSLFYETNLDEDHKIDSSKFYIIIKSNNLDYENIIHKIEEKSDLDFETNNFLSNSNQIAIETAIPIGLKQGGSLEHQKKLEQLKNVELILTRLDIAARYSYKIKVHVKDENVDNQKQSLAKELICDFNLKNINMIEKENYLSVTGFKPGLKEYIVLKDRKINLQLVINGNHNTNKASVLVGIPIIDDAY